MNFIRYQYKKEPMGGEQYYMIYRKFAFFPWQFYERWNTKESVSIRLTELNDKRRGMKRGKMEINELPIRFQKFKPEAIFRALQPFVINCGICEGTMIATLKKMENSLVFKCLDCGEELLSGNAGILTEWVPGDVTEKHEL